MKQDDDMSNTFIAEVGQKSAIADIKENDSIFPEVNIEPPKEMVETPEPKENIIAEVLPENNKDNNFNKSNKKRINPILTIVLMILSLALGVGGTYYYFEFIDNSKEPVKKVVTEKEDNKELSPDSIFITNLISKYDYYSISNSEIFTNLYKEDSLKVEAIDEMYLKDLVAKNASKDLATSTFTSEDFKTSTEELFGDKISLTDTDITSYSTKCDCLKYNSTTKMYTPTSSICNETTDLSMRRKIVKSLTKNETLEVVVAPALLDKEYVYKSVESDKPIDKIEGVTPETFDIDKDYTKLNQYKYTFDYDQENNIYRLNKIELVK